MGGKAEKGSTKWLSNNMKSKGLQRLRWYCQVCERQMRDENGFKQHCLSEAHNRNMQIVGEDSRKFINQYSDDFKRDFLRLLRTAHGEKKVHANHFYQEYISDKQHTHMNATRWPSLTEFVKYLGREGICRVEEGERGLEIAWIDDSPEALRRREAVARKDKMERGDEERQARMLEAQIKRANEQKREQQTQDHMLDRKDTGPISFTFGAPTPKEKVAQQLEADASDTKGSGTMLDGETQALKLEDGKVNPSEEPKKDEPAKTMSISMNTTNAKSKPINVFSSKNNPLKQKRAAVMEQPKKMSELERVMLADKEEQERKRQRMHDRDAGRGKRVKLG
ncbi:zinc finger protein RTS2 [Myriangium duriaei CBS 260.36]|uniref:Zinc finger protein RTS2 n=1 Tax=Myriangium duriaei CBS 260.36 TaxID=1168546 RepID=A0A9P4JAL1_9PEZI|nr:zinc finger protein RTS2 [Myriangium duriaei CBS 260.36]